MQAVGALQAGGIRHKSGQGSKFEYWVWSGGPRGQELEDIFGGAGSGRVGLGIRNDNDQSYRRTFSIFFSYSVFRVPVADNLEFEL
jgi:hypothetical protein